MNFKKIRFIIFPLVLAVILAVLLYLVISGTFWSLLKETDKNAKLLAEKISGQGILSWLAVIALQIVQVIIFVIPGEFTQVASGYIFGIFTGAVLTIIGITIGSVANFYIARLSGGDFITKIVGREKFLKFREVLSEDRQIFTFFILFLIPGIPKDIVCYFAGLSRVSIGRFLFFSTFGRLPGIIISVIIGSLLLKQNWVLTIILAAVSVLFFIVGLLLRKKFIKVKV